MFSKAEMYFEYFNCNIQQQKEYLGIGVDFAPIKNAIRSLKTIYEMAEKQQQQQRTIVGWYVKNIYEWKEEIVFDES